MPGVTGVHHLHVWSLDSETPALTAHLQFAHDTDLHRAQALADAASGALRERFGIVHTTFQVECGDCVEAPVTFTPRAGPTATPTTTDPLAHVVAFRRPGEPGGGRWPTGGRRWSR